MVVAFLTYCTVMEQKSPVVFLHDSLRDKRAPDVGHSEAAIGRQVYEVWSDIGVRFPEPWGGNRDLISSP